MDRRLFLFGLGSSVLLAGCSGLGGPNAPYASKSQLMTYADEAARRFNVPKDWIVGVMWQESRFRTHFSNGKPVVSHAGAIGPMQVMPGTYRELRSRYRFLGPSPYDPRDNVLAGTAYIREMYDRFGAPGFLAAYNAGPGRYEQFVKQGRRLPAETRNYVSVVSNRIWGSRAPRLGRPVWYGSLDRERRASLSGGGFLTTMFR